VRPQEHMAKLRLLKTGHGDLCLAGVPGEDEAERRQQGGFGWLIRRREQLEGVPVDGVPRA